VRKKRGGISSSRNYLPRKEELHRAIFPSSRLKGGIGIKEGDVDSRAKLAKIEAVPTSFPTIPRYHSLLKILLKEEGKRVLAELLSL